MSLLQLLTDVKSTIALKINTDRVHTRAPQRLGNLSSKLSQKSKLFWYAWKLLKVEPTMIWFVAWTHFLAWIHWVSILWLKLTIYQFKYLESAAFFAVRYEQHQWTHFKHQKIIQIELGNSSIIAGKIRTVPVAYNNWVFLVGQQGYIEQ